MKRRCSINIWVGLGVTLALLGAPLRAEFVYVADVNNEVWGYTISPATGALTSIAGSPFPVGLEPGSVAVDPSGKFAYVANTGITGIHPTGSVSGYSINPATGALTPIAGSPFAAGDSPYSVAVDSSGKFAYVVNTDGSNVSGYTINPVTGALTPIAGSPFLTGAAPVSVAITRAKPIVRAVYVTNEGSKSVSVINPTTNTVVATVTVGPIPVDAVVTPNGASAYITDAGANTVSVINTATNSLAATVGVGWLPVDAAVTPDGSNVYVTNAGSGTVSVISTASNTVVATIPVGDALSPHFHWTSLADSFFSNPVHIAIAPDGARAYVTDAGSHNVSVIDTATYPVIAKVQVGRAPSMSPYCPTAPGLM
jgi:6-phosphogluconolactonase